MRLWWEYCWCSAKVCESHFTSCSVIRAHWVYFLYYYTNNILILFFCTDLNSIMWNNPTILQIKITLKPQATKIYVLSMLICYLQEAFQHMTAPHAFREKAAPRRLSVVKLVWNQQVQPWCNSVQSVCIISTWSVYTNWWGIFRATL